LGAEAGRSLYEDWLFRRERLEAQGAPLGHGYAEAVARVLDYLLERYRDAPEAAVPARFPAPATVYLNRRAITVHDYLGRGQFSAIKTEEQARNRVSGILKRIASHDPQDAARRFQAGEQWATCPNIRWQGGASARAEQWAEAICARTKAARVVCSGAEPHEISAAINDLLEVTQWFPSAVVQRCFEQALIGNIAAAQALMRCRNRSAQDYIFLVWRYRIALDVNDPVAVQFCQHLLNNPHWTGSVEKFRTELANEHPNVRTEAARVLQAIGDLHDIGLLLELAALPPDSGERPGERDVYLDAARALAGQAVAKDASHA